MSHAYIDQLEPAQFVQGAYAVQNCQVGQTKAGKPFLKMLLVDKTGRTPGRMWNVPEGLPDRLPTDGFVYLEGQTQPYQGEIQIIVQRIEPHEPTDRELVELLPATKFDIDTMFGEVLTLLNSLEHPAIGALRDRYLEDADLMGAFCKAPAAREVHHARIGGLLEHTRSLMLGAEALLPNYPGVSRDLVLFGLFLHDLGKCLELSWNTGFAYTADGELVGHIARGCTILRQKVAACLDPELGDAAIDVPEPILLALEHILLSHHGQPEFGALKLPATPEAVFVSCLDNLDAKMDLVLEAANRKALGHGAPDRQGDFTQRIWALNTRVYRPDPTAPAE
ncbi:MAG: HD domain-containing protein [Planctomycetota bacterium]